MSEDRGGPEQRDGQVFHVLVSTVEQTWMPILFFPYPSSLGIERACPAGYVVKEIARADTDVRITYSATKRFMYNAIAHTFKAGNVRKGKPDGRTNIFWGEHLKATEFAALLLFQKVNHFPGSFELGRKDKLCGNLLRMRKKHPTAYVGVIPETYLTANDYDRQQFLAQFHADASVLWILKPPNLSCGRGIKLLMAATTPNPKLSKKKAFVAQRYIANPFLINDLKFDLRIYVLVTSYDPLRIYLFDDGLVRFCTEKYSTSKSGLKNQFGHLTNYSVNKKNKAAFQQNEDSGDQESSSKWTLKQFFKYIHDKGLEKELQAFHVALDDLIIKTLIAVEPKIVSTTNGDAESHGFELYGFDILLEGEQMKPWLLEVNVFPSLSSSSPMDKRVKTILVSDVFQLVGVPFKDIRATSLQVEKDKKDRLLGMTKKVNAAANNDRKRVRKTVDDLVKMGKLSDLDDSDLQIVKEMEEEELRRGHFQRIFPTAQSFERYNQLFEVARYKTTLCMLWLQQTGGDNRRRSNQHGRKQ
ncbi:TPA: hypothetical protein N0F65_009754 [Lagenidium giganteum]|uniref:Tubulin--tyrosine ligase-like protein 5 n=1 Tax=Lagenidium giganteum TaxID=4803 RepID=A0AAV2YP47_9STRA|nr:TPA: hypothetical protein N0F65_009754 [Lagenidium giganteum]